MVWFDSVSVYCLGEEGVVHGLEVIGGPFIVFDSVGSFPFRFHLG